MNHQWKPVNVLSPNSKSGFEVRHYKCDKCGAGPVMKKALAHKSSITKLAKEQGFSSDCNVEIVRKITEELHMRGACTRDGKKKKFKKQNSVESMKVTDSDGFSHYVPDISVLKFDFGYAENGNLGCYFIWKEKSYLFHTTKEFTGDRHRKRFIERAAILFAKIEYGLYKIEKGKPLQERRIVKTICKVWDDASLEECFEEARNLLKIQEVMAS